MNTATSADPFTILGVSRDAGEVEVRARYLELVKQYPPAREPEKFREIRAAFEAARDPLAIARRLVMPPDDEVPQWSQVIEAQKRNPPRLTPAFLLSLGNRALDGVGPSPEDSTDPLPRDSKSSDDQDSRTDTP
jgi:hypothetical protein